MKLYIYIYDTLLSIYFEKHIYHLNQYMTVESYNMLIELAFQITNLVEEHGNKNLLNIYANLLSFKLTKENIIGVQCSFCCNTI